jgi:hypothetical protein
MNFIKVTDVDQGPIIINAATIRYVCVENRIMNRHTGATERSTFIQIADPNYDDGPLPYTGHYVSETIEEIFAQLTT